MLRMNSKNAFLSAIFVIILLIFTSVAFSEGETLQVLNDTAVSLFEQGKYDEAAELAERALKTAEETMGAGNPKIAPFLNNLAVIYDAQERYAEAVDLYERAKGITEPVYGADHPRVRSLAESLEKCRGKLPEQQIQECPEETDAPDDAEEQDDLLVPAGTEEVQAPQEPAEAATQESPQNRPDSTRTFFTVQLGAFGRLQNAKSLQEKLFNNGYDVSVTTVTAENGNILHKVQAGQFRDLQKAKLLAREIKTLLGLDTFITTK